jgi:hypothetical protein
LALVASVGIMMLFAVAAPHVPAPPIVRFALGYGLLIACLLGTARAAPPVNRRWAAFALLPAALPVAVGVVGPPSGSFAAAAAVFVGILAAGTWLGAFLGGEIEHPGHLLPVAVASALADAASVLAPSGPTARVLSDHPDVLAVVALPWSFGDRAFVPVLGVGDVLMTGLYLAACRKHGLPVARAVAALAVAYAALLVALFLAARPLPALPALGLAVVLAFPEARRLPAPDRTKAWVAMVALTALTAWVLLR